MDKHYRKALLRLTRAVTFEHVASGPEVFYFQCPICGRCFHVSDLAMSQKASARPDSHQESCALGQALVLLATGE